MQCCYWQAAQGCLDILCISENEELPTKKGMHQEQKLLVDRQWLKCKLAHKMENSYYIMGAEIFQKSRSHSKILGGRMGI
jgi:hypothetical protein